MKSSPSFVFIVGFLLSVWVRPALGGSDVLIYAVCKRDIETIKLILADHKDVNEPQFGAFGMTPLDLAVANGFVDVTDMLLEAGAKPSQKTFFYPCSRDEMERLCLRFPKWAQHEGCRAAKGTDRWLRVCKAPDGNCSQVLRE